ncbi:MAG: hypothetical protein IID08_05060 [Candidatus Hydrogenedentes bacterium]|nr:hypothetical protein [Candidatus Hydrogenedentota bacterium]
MSEIHEARKKWGMTTIGGVIAAAVLVGGIVAIVPAVEKKLGFCATESDVSADDTSVLGSVLAAAEPLLDLCATESGTECAVESNAAAAEATPAANATDIVLALAAEESTPFTPIECTLSAAEQREARDTVLTDLWSAAEDVQRTESGLTMRFPAKMMHAITDYIAVESDCCSFFSFRLDVPPNGAPISLGIFGPPAAQSLIDDMIESIETAPKAESE